MNFKCQFCGCNDINLIEKKSVIVQTKVNDENLGVISYGFCTSLTESKLRFECANCKRLVAHDEKELVKVLNEKPGIKLYVLDEGNPETTIPILTDRPICIRGDVGNQDHGGMEYEDFARVCDNAQIKQIKKKKDLPPELLDSYPYGGGTVGFRMVTCRELIKLMDKDGIISPLAIEQF